MIKVKLREGSDGEKARQYLGQEVIGLMEPSSVQSGIRARLTEYSDWTMHYAWKISEFAETHLVSNSNSKRYFLKIC